MHNTSTGRNYALPQDNPYKGKSNGFSDEIYAYGLRNAWRFSFDQQSGMIWAGDVGQNKIEEVDIIEKVGKYDWRAI